MKLLRRRREPTPQVWIADPAAVGITDAEHLNGVPWYDAPLPPKRHECWAQTRGWYRMLTRVERCPCGGMTYGEPGIWLEKNKRTRP